MLLRHILHVVPFFSLSNWMDKTFCCQFWCCISFTLNQSELGSEFTRATLCFYRWWWDPDQDVHLTPQVPSKPSWWQTPLFPIADYSHLLVNNNKLKVLSTLDAPAYRKMKRLISFQMGQLYSSLRAHAVRSEHDLVNFWLWTVGVELWPN